MAEKNPNIYVSPDGEHVEIPEGAQVERWRDVPAEERAPDGEQRADDDIILWRNPPTGTAMHPDQLKARQEIARERLAVDPEDPEFQDPESIEKLPTKVARESVHRRVLQAVTDEVDDHRLGPRNTVDAIAAQLSSDRFTPQINAPSEAWLRVTSGGTVSVGHGWLTAEKQVRASLAVLLKHGLVADRGDGTFELTREGKREVAN